jgi:hypothetical protein
MKSEKIHSEKHFRITKGVIGTKTEKNFKKKRGQRDKMPWDILQVDSFPFTLTNKDRLPFIVQERRLWAMGKPMDKTIRR